MLAALQGKVTMAEGAVCVLHVALRVLFRSDQIMVFLVIAPKSLDGKSGRAIS